MRLSIILIFLTLTSIRFAHAAKVDTLIIHSKSMDKDIKNVVILPEGYSNESDAYAVVYLLHGAGGNYAQWVTGAPGIKDFADQNNRIVVCPDGGKTSWYFDSPIDPKYQYETYVSSELIEAIDQKFHTIKDKSGRAISGLSMGGHGAFYLAFRHQDIWGAAGSTSGGLDLRPFPNNWDIAKRIGIYSENPERWEQSSIINMLYLVGGKQLKLIFDCGVDDFFYKVNKNLHELMIERNIPHDYIERPGKHNMAYWKNSIQYQLMFFNNFFDDGH